MPEDRAPSTKYFRPASERLGVVALEGGQDVERQRLQLDRRHRARSGRRPRPSCPCRGRPAGSAPDTRTGCCAPANQRSPSRWRRRWPVDGHLGEDGRGHRRSSRREGRAARPDGGQTPRRRPAADHGRQRNGVAAVCREGAADQDEGRAARTVREGRSGRARVKHVTPVLLSHRRGVVGADQCSTDALVMLRRGRAKPSTSVPTISGAKISTSRS